MPCYEIGRKHQSRRLRWLFWKTPREEPRAKTFPFWPAGLAALAKSPAARVSQPVGHQVSSLAGVAGEAGEAVGPGAVWLGAGRQASQEACATTLGNAGVLCSSP